MSDLQLGMLSS